jgi:flavin reductase (DIM6/NTAB) family NADH-FMN oxidoreductase RutF
MQHITADQLPHMEQRYRSNLINCLSGFKNLSLLGSIDEKGQTNLAVFSQVFHIGADPALIGVLVRPQSVRRHSLANILQSGDFTLNNVREHMLLRAHQTSARWEESEFSACGFTPWFSPQIKAPYVTESTLRIGLRLAEALPLTINNTVLVIGSVQEIWVPEYCLQPDGFIDLETAGSLSCSGLDSYHYTLSLGRLSYAKTDRVPEFLNQEQL